MTTKQRTNATPPPANEWTDYKYLPRLGDIVTIEGEEERGEWEITKINPQGYDCHELTHTITRETAGAVYHEGGLQPATRRKPTLALRCGALVNLDVWEKCNETASARAKADSIERVRESGEAERLRLVTAAMKLCATLTGLAARFPDLAHVLTADALYCVNYRSTMMGEEGLCTCGGTDLRRWNGKHNCAPWKVIYAREWATRIAAGRDVASEIASLKRMFPVPALMRPPAVRSSPWKELRAEWQMFIAEVEGDAP